MKETKKKEKKVSEQNEGKMPVKYIKQPYPISAMQADLSRQQIRILVGMMQSIQDGVQELFSKPTPEDGQLLLFPDLADEHVNIDFKFSDVVDRPDSYKNVEKVADKFMSLVFRYEDKEAGEVTLSHFVDKVSYPSRGSKRDRIRFSFTREQARQVFNFTMYSRYIQSVAFNAENKYTARLYMLITSARGFEKESEGIFHWYVGYNELRRMLGCDTKEGNTWRRSTQLLYKHFKSNILKTAEEELKALADAGKSDCWFEYVELPEERKGDPERFDFIVHLSEMGKLENSHTRELQQLNHITAFMQKEWGMTEHECSKLLSNLHSNNFTLFNTKMHALAIDMQKKGSQIKNRKLYAKKSLSEAIKEIKASKEQPTVLGGSHSPALGGSPIESPSTPASDGLPIGSSSTDHDLKGKWLKLAGNKNYQTYLSQVKLRHQGDKLTAIVPHTEVKEWMQQFGLPKLGVNEVTVDS